MDCDPREFVPLIRLPTLGSTVDKIYYKVNEDSESRDESVDRMLGTALKSTNSHAYYLDEEGYECTPFYSNSHLFISDVPLCAYTVFYVFISPYGSHEVLQGRLSFNAEKTVGIASVGLENQEFPIQALPQDYKRQNIEVKGINADNEVYTLHYPYATYWNYYGYNTLPNLNGVFSEGTSSFYPYSPNGVGYGSSTPSIGLNEVTFSCLNYEYDQENEKMTRQYLTYNFYIKVTDEPETTVVSTSDKLQFELINNPPVWYKDSGTAQEQINGSVKMKIGKYISDSGYVWRSEITDNLTYIINDSANTFDVEYSYFGNMGNYLVASSKQSYTLATRRTGGYYINDNNGPQYFGVPNQVISPMPNGFPITTYFTNLESTEGFSMELLQAPTKTTYDLFFEEEAVIDLTGLSFRANYPDGTSKVFTYEDGDSIYRYADTITPQIITTAGTYNIQLGFNIGSEQVYLSFEVNVVSSQIEAYSISTRYYTGSNNLIFYIGETYEHFKEQYKVMASLRDGTTREVENFDLTDINGVKIELEVSSEVQTAYLYYRGEVLSDCSVNFEVTLSWGDIICTTLPTKKEYLTTDTFNTLGLAGPYYYGEPHTSLYPNYVSHEINQEDFYIYTPEYDSSTKDGTERYVRGQYKLLTSSDYIYGKSERDFYKITIYRPSTLTVSPTSFDIGLGGSISINDFTFTRTLDGETTTLSSSDVTIDDSRVNYNTPGSYTVIFKAKGTSTTATINIKNYTLTVSPTTVYTVVGSTKIEQDFTVTKTDWQGQQTTITDYTFNYDSSRLGMVGTFTGQITDGRKSVNITIININTPSDEYITQDNSDYKTAFSWKHASHTNDKSYGYITSPSDDGYIHIYNGTVECTNSANETIQCLLYKKHWPITINAQKKIVYTINSTDYYLNIDEEISFSDIYILCHQYIREGQNYSYCAFPTIYLPDATVNGVSQPIMLHYNGTSLHYRNDTPYIINGNTFPQLNATNYRRIYVNADTYFYTTTHYMANITWGFIPEGIEVLLSEGYYFNHDDTIEELPRGYKVFDSNLNILSTNPLNIQLNTTTNTYAHYSLSLPTPLESESIGSVRSFLNNNFLVYKDSQYVYYYNTSSITGTPANVPVSNIYEDDFPPKLMANNYNIFSGGINYQVSILLSNGITVNTDYSFNYSKTNYALKSFTQSINDIVSNESVVNISAGVNSNETHFARGDTFTYNTLHVYATTQVLPNTLRVRNNIEVIPPDMTTSGTKNVTVKYTIPGYKTLTTTYEITVD